MTDSALRFEWVDVFAAAPYGGNPLPVVFGAEGLDDAALLRITQEFRQFETIFVFPTEAPDCWRARIFDLFEELPFAGHPLLGAAAVLGANSDLSELEFLVRDRRVRMRVQCHSDEIVAWLDAGSPGFLTGAIDAHDRVASAFALSREDLHPTLPIQTVTTGLRYLVVPVRRGALARASVPADIGALVRAYDADFAVLLDAEGREQRHWNNDGKLEDYATGSAASVVAAYLVRHGGALPGEAVTLHQGSYAGRPSEILVRVDGIAPNERVQVGGRVQRIGEGTLFQAPSRLATTTDAAPNPAPR